MHDVNIEERTKEKCQVLVLLLFSSISTHIQCLRWLKDRGNYWHLSSKSSTTHHAEGNNMTSPTQTVVGKGILNPLTTERLLKILRDLIPPSLPKSLTIPIHGMVKLQKAVIISPAK